MAEHYAEAVSTVLAEHEALVKQALQGMVLDITAVLAAEDAVAHGRIDYVATRLAARKAEIAFARASGAYTRSGRGEP